MLKELVEELISLYNFWSGVMFLLQFLAYVVYLNSSYVPTGPNAIAYCFQLILFLAVNFVISAFEGVAISFLLKPFKALLSWLFDIF